MPAHRERDERPYVLRRFMEGLASGEISLCDLRPVSRLSPELIAKGWHNAVTMLRQRSATDDLVRSLHILKDADPGFGSSDFLLGMAYFQTNKFAAARRYFQQQLDAVNGLHADESRRMLAMLT